MTKVGNGSLSNEGRPEDERKKLSAKMAFKCKFEIFKFAINY